LGIDVEGHLAVGVPDLSHHPLHVEVVREQRDRDVDTAQAMRGRVRQRGKAARERLASLGGGSSFDRAHSVQFAQVIERTLVAT
jgi:hypothetical protein